MCPSRPQRLTGAVVPVYARAKTSMGAVDPSAGEAKTSVRMSMMSLTWPVSVCLHRGHVELPAPPLRSTHSAMHASQKAWPHSSRSTGDCISSWQMTHSSAPRSASSSAVRRRPTAGGSCSGGRCPLSASTRICRSAWASRRLERSSGSSQQLTSRRRGRESWSLRKHMSTSIHRGPSQSESWCLVLLTCAHRSQHTHRGTGAARRTALRPISHATLSSRRRSRRVGGMSRPTASLADMLMRQMHTSMASVRRPRRRAEGEVIGRIAPATSSPRVSSSLSGGAGGPRFMTARTPALG
mmetsp:Transcript_17047/g.46052  ORF Transcript_17047/g.46052 Transcript_17047/m.46052 type:complete len:297 (-) Transcript_17047:874-1764(-)